jgi:hypothetical protein
MSPLQAGLSNGLHIKRMDTKECKCSRDQRLNVPYEARIIIHHTISQHWPNKKKKFIVYQNDLAMRNTADVKGGKPIT